MFVVKHYILGGPCMKKLIGICLILSAVIPVSAQNEKTVFQKIALEISSLRPKLQSGAVTVLPFETVGFPDRSQGVYVSDQISAALSGAGNVTLVERERLDTVIKEKELTLTGLIDKEEVRKIGTLLAIDALVMGRVYKTEQGYDIFVKVVDTRSGSVLTMFSHKCSSETVAGGDKNSPWYAGTWKVVTTAPYLVEQDMRYEKLVLRNDDTFSLFLINNADRFVEIQGRYSVDKNNINYRAMQMYFDGNPTSFTRMSTRLEGTIFLVEGRLYFNYAGEGKKDRARADAMDPRYRCVAERRKE